MPATSKKQTRVAAWYTKVADFNVESLFSSRNPPGPKRRIFVNEPLPADYHDKKGRVLPQNTYSTNQVITSKYTLITFLPRNLLEQFRRIANVFFAGIAILQFFPKFSTISPGLVLFPLLVVLTITALKDGYEDIKRHQSDSRVNHTKVRVLSGAAWSNPNAMRNKSRTFGWSLIPATITSKLHRGNKSSPPDPEQKEVQSPTMEFDAPNLEDQLSRSGSRPHAAHWKQTMWEDIRVGDFVKIMENESIPADVLICSTSEEENVAYVETKNLDGETNLKSRNAVPHLTHLNTAEQCSNSQNSLQIDCGRPDSDMFKLNATVGVGKERSTVDISMTLLRGTVLKNTSWVIGVVLFTGHDTKIVQNSGGTPSKRSKVERQMNPQVFLNLLILAMMAVTCGVVDSVIEHEKYPQGALWLYGANLKDDNPSINGLVTWAYALITFQNIVPISLYISIEFVRTAQAAFIYFDHEIWYAKTNQATLARTWNLSDDLGQIEYIFSDKTGTLTQNHMIFRQCSIGGKVYKDDIQVPLSESVPERQGSASPVDSGHHLSNEPKAPSLSAPDETRFHSSELDKDIAQLLGVTPDSEQSNQARILNGFFTVLALCHTVLTSKDPLTGKISYRAASPDEAALVNAAADAGYVFQKRDREVMYLKKPSTSQDTEDIERYELLNVLEFTSARKRMSVVLRRLDSPDGKILLLCKGADNVIFERLKKGSDEDLRQTTEAHLNEFANGGLRTLTLAYKVVSAEEYDRWSELYHEATLSVENREIQVEEVYDELERNLRLLGATAIEDSLQEGVPETIADLKKAGIKIWVATGDKLETAIAIGHSTNLIAPESNIIVIRGGTPPSRNVYEQMRNAIQTFFPDSDILDAEGAVATPRPSTSSRHSRSASDTYRPTLRRSATGVSSIVGQGNGERPGGFVLVIDGTALSYVFEHETHQSLLLSLATLCEGVICCRVSPLQKALIVRMVKNGLGVMTLAIGDGANDVSMIQAADVGVGISGEEGLQAVNSSDYAIAQFRFLKRLLLVHGHWSYARNGNLVVNFFYKNVVVIGILWWFQLYNGWSSTYVFEYTYLLFWNAFWTIAPVVAMGLFDRIVGKRSPVTGAVPSLTVIFVDARVLMAYPELYRHGREGQWFGMKIFAVYMLDGVYQSTIIYFFIMYTYMSPTARSDGYDVRLLEFSTVMVLSAVLTANLYNGLNTNVWTAWVFFAVFIGIVLVWIFTAVFNSISPGWFSTLVYGNNHFLFPSPLFWFSIILTVVLSLLPRFLYKAWQFGFAPTDIDIMRYVMKTEPHRLQLAEETLSRTASRSSAASGPSHPRQQQLGHHPSASRTDMSTGLRSLHRGFDFATEEGGVAMERIQSNLSERRQHGRHGSRHKHKLSEGVTQVLTLPKSFMKKKKKTRPVS